MDPGERATFLDRECRDDDEARAEVESMLRHHAAAGGEESRGEESRGEEAEGPDPDATVDVPTPSPSAFDPAEGDGDDDSVDAGSPASLSRHIAGGGYETLDDFGVAKATDLRLTERTVYTEVGRMIGTLEYMSPEQAEMRPGLRLVFRMMRPRQPLSAAIG